jgi:hypothetical protein
MAVALEIIKNMDVMQSGQRLGVFFLRFMTLWNEILLLKGLKIPPSKFGYIVLLKKLIKVAFIYFKYKISRQFEPLN